MNERASLPFNLLDGRLAGSIRRIFFLALTGLIAS